MDQATIEDVASRAGVSVATVSRALRGLPNVAPSTRERVVQVARELRYTPDPHAARLAAGRTHTIALAAPTVAAWHFGQVLAGVEAVLSSSGFDLLLYSVAGAEERHRFLVEDRPFAKRVDGMILVDLEVTDDEAAELVASGVRAVTVGRRTPALPSVTIDNDQAAGLATRHLVNLGHDRIGLIGAEDDHRLHLSVPVVRRQAYLRVLAESGLECPPQLLQAGNFSVKGGADAMSTLLALREPPSAVFALSDEMAMGAMKAAADLGLVVPGDVSVVGFDDHELAEVMGLTTVHQGVVDKGAVAARLLLGAMADGAGEPTHVVAPTRLVVRTSTAPPDDSRPPTGTARRWVA